MTSPLAPPDKSAYAATTDSTTPSTDEKYLDSKGYGSGGHNIFSDPTTASYWTRIYEKAQYEGRHRFAPAHTWTAAEERKLLRKIDFRIMTWAWIMFLSLDFNRRNINRAITNNMLEQLGTNTNGFNYGQTIFLASFLAAELPSGLISKKVGPDRWIPFIIVAWSIVSASQAGLTNPTGYYVCRCLIGLFMGGFIPDVVLYLTYFYKSGELPLRLAWFWTALSTCNILGSLLGAAILEMEGVCGWHGWQWLFLIEGLVTGIVGILSWGLMPAGPTQTKGWMRGKTGWFSEHEEYILVTRLLRDDPSKGDLHNRAAVGPIALLKSIRDWDLWPVYLLGLMIYIPAQPIQTYLALNLKTGLGFTTFQANLLTIPSQFLFAVNLLLLSWLSRKIGERAIVSSISNIWILPWLVALVALPDGANPWVRYTVLTGLLSYPYCHAVLVAWNSQNSNTVRTRAVSAALYNMCVQAGNIIATNIYRDDDKPLYKRGNKILLGICCVNITLFWAVKAYFVTRNKQKENVWSKMNRQEQEIYVETTKDEGMKRLDFRFVH